MTGFSFERLDRDGLLQDAGRGVRHDAQQLRPALRRGRGGVLLAAVAAPAALAAGSTVRNRAILNFALSLEYLQDSFYTRGRAIGALTGELARQARTVGAHERAHVKALRETLGAAAVARGRYDFRGATESEDAFRRTAVAFEDLAVAAYKGQAPRLHSRGYLAAALAIHSVEARHAAWIRRLAGITPAASAFDDPITSRRQGISSRPRSCHDDAFESPSSVHGLNRRMSLSALAVGVALGVSVAVVPRPSGRRADAQGGAFELRAPAVPPRPRSVSPSLCRRTVGARRHRYWAAPSCAGLARRASATSAAAVAFSPHARPRRRPTSSSWSGKGRGDGSLWLRVRLPDPSEQPHRLDPSLGGRRLRRSPHAARRRPFASRGDALPRRPSDLPGTCRYRQALLTHAAGQFLHPGSRQRLHRSVLRSARVRNERPLCGSDRLAGGWIHRHSRHESPGSDPGSRLHGCIRMRNADILKLGRLMPTGTPLTIT